MKILFVSSSMGYGGAERVISVISSELARRGHEVGIYTTKPTTESVYPLDPAVRIYSEEKLGSLTDVVKSIRAFVVKYDPDIVVPFMTYQCIYTVFALAFTKYPVVVCERNDPHVLDGQNTSKLHFAIRDMAFGLAKGAVFQTEGARDYFSRGIRKKSTVILNPINESALTDVHTGERENRIVNVGRLNKQKNQALLISSFSDIASEFPEMILEIYGDGEEKDNLCRLASELGVSERVHFMGNVSGVSEKIKSAGVFAFTSDYEGMPNALAEAMALGIPSISTDCSPGGARMLIDDKKNGLLVQTGDRDAFSQALRCMCSDPVYARKLGEAAISVRDKLKLENVADMWEEYLSSLALKNKKVK